ncbi:hypothetical protein F5Y12DRAFT_113343 [Xylaria sp. FL1777]|nr:hypothetical protein F5Y12DRAFT_113343 [Xylaria sp. FL1777]
MRRASHQLLIAAAIGKQYREVTVADHSGHNVPGADRAVPLKHRQFDARSEASLTVTEAMARSFRNWANREARDRFRSRSHTPTPVVVSDRTTGPEDTFSGSRGESSFTDDTAGVAAAMALIYNPELGGEDDSDDEDDKDDETGGLLNLGFNDVSDDIKFAACAMLAAAEQATGEEEEDWADVLAGQVLKSLYNTPPSTVKSHQEDANLYSDDDLSDLSDEGEAIRKYANFLRNYKKTTAAIPKWPGKKPGQKSKLRGGSKGQSFIPGKLRATLKYIKQQALEQEQQFPTPTSQPWPSSPEQRYTEGWSDRKPNKPATPSQSVWDPTRWLVNIKDADDGIWAGKEAAHTQPTDKMETGFVKWETQETRFPRLDDRLMLYDARGPAPMIFDPATVDTQVWDPLNRTITEPKTGKRTPLRLNPITTHSLARWTATEFGTYYSLDPIRLPDNPPPQDKKRPLRSVTFSTPKSTTKPKTAGTGQGLFGNGAKMKGWTKKKQVAFALSSLAATPKKEFPMAFTSQAATVASVHYPLKSPAAQSISKSHPAGQHDAAGSEQQQQKQAGFAAIAGLRNPPGVWTSAQGPPTPYPKTPSTSTPDSPTVALYEHTAEAPDEKSPGSTGKLVSEEDEKFSAFFEATRFSANGGSSKKNSGKRAAADEFAETSGPAKKRKTYGGDSEKENGKSRGDALGLGSGSGSGSGTGYKGEEELLSSSSLKAKRSNEKKSVRFDVSHHEGGPSSGMRDGARRALGRYSRTSSRRGSLGPFR